MNIGASSIAWTSTARTLFGMKVTRDVAELEAVRGRQRQHDIVLGRRRLQLEVELAAETLAQRQSPGSIDAAAERRVDDELHAARFVEEPLEDDRVLRRQAAEGGRGSGQIVDELFGGGCADADSSASQRRAPVPEASDSQSRRDFGAQARDGSRKLVGPARRLAEPERNVRRLALASSTRTVPRSTR